jgi:hypothetical protein
VVELYTSNFLYKISPCRFKKIRYYLLHNSILCYAIYFSFLLMFSFSALLHNNTKSFMLPYKIHTFFDITNTRTYILMYLYLFPMLYASICHMAAICLVVILVFHICGELSILSYRIRNIDMYSQDMMMDRIRSFVQIHLKIVWWAYYSRILACKMYNCLFLRLIYRQSALILLSSFRTRFCRNAMVIKGWRNPWMILSIWFFSMNFLAIVLY